MILDIQYHNKFITNYPILKGSNINNIILIKMVNKLFHLMILIYSYLNTIHLVKVVSFQEEIEVYFL